MCTVGTGGGGELVAVGTAWSQGGEHFPMSGLREGQGHSHPAGEVVFSALTPHSLFLSHKSALRAQCVLTRGKEHWSGLSSLTGLEKRERGAVPSSLNPKSFRPHKPGSKSVANPEIESISQLLPWCM